MRSPARLHHGLSLLLVWGCLGWAPRFAREPRSLLSISEASSRSAPLIRDRPSRDALLFLVLSLLRAQIISSARVLLPLLLFPPAFADGDSQTFCARSLVLPETAIPLFFQCSNTANLPQRNPALAWNRLILSLLLLTLISARGHDLLADVPEAPNGHTDAGPTPPAADQPAGTIIDETVIARP